MKILLSLMVIVLLAAFAISHSEDTFALGEQLIKDKIPCSNLSDEQFELIGEYYMDQMHPGELHEIMDERMGGEGSEQLRQVHIALAKNFYCGEHQAMMPTMMNTMMGRTGFDGMIQRGLFSGEGMIGSAAGISGFLLVLLGIGLIVLIILFIIKLLRELR